MERRRRNLVADRASPRSFTSRTGERLDMIARGLLSRVMGLTSRSRTALPLAEASLRARGLLCR